MNIELAPHQLKAINELKTGSILVGGVGTGKSRTALAYYFLKECKGSLKINGIGNVKTMQNPKDLYIITTARKRDTLDWEKEAAPFCITNDRSSSINQVLLTVDSWNNIKKYEKIENAFFIFDEQRVVGYGVWSKTFINISRKNHWILLSATPGDTWSDYIPVFIANGFYKNKTQFEREHIVYSRFSKFPKIEKYIGTGTLLKHRRDITVQMICKKPTRGHKETLITKYDKDLYKIAGVNRWNPYTNQPIRDASEYCYTLRRIVNSDSSRLEEIKNIWKQYPKIIVFYNFDYELDILRTLEELGTIAEWNGHKHEQIPKASKWCYIVQYTACAEGWNCIETNVIVFYSQNYSYKIMVQAAGRIDRMNTPYLDLYYYHLRSTSSIDIAILRALEKKKSFNEKSFASF